MKTLYFNNRADAGSLLAKAIENSSILLGNCVVLGLARGGIPVALQLAQSLNIEWQPLIVRKLGVPSQPELAFGAIACGGSIYLNRKLIQSLKIKDTEIKDIIHHEKQAIKQRQQRYGISTNQADTHLNGKTLIVCDDGIATGASMQAALLALKTVPNVRIIVATPVAPAEAIRQLKDIADQVICLQSPKDFHSVGQYYIDFNQTSDEQVCKFLQQKSAGPMGT